MNISGKSESSGKPRTTADIAAAARRGDAATPDTDADELPVVVGERTQSQETARTTRERSDDAQHARAREKSDTPQHRAQPGLAEQPVVVDRSEGTARRDEALQSKAHPAEALEPLFTQELAEGYRTRWTSIQSSFVDDPRHAVHKGDELVAEIMTNLADSFSQERRRLESQLDETGEGTTENLRVALRRYRSFFERLLSL